jgi:hypothetical protein
MAKGKKTGGRKPGSTNKLSAEIKALAQKHGPEMIEGLLAMARDEEAPHASRIAAQKEVLDRGFGRPAQVQILAGEDGEGPIKHEFSWAVSKGS